MIKKNKAEAEDVTTDPNAKIADIMNKLKTIRTEKSIKKSKADEQISNKSKPPSGAQPPKPKIKTVNQKPSDSLSEKFSQLSPSVGSNMGKYISTNYISRLFM